MGFYLELHPASKNEFVEGPPPSVFWVFYGILGFALSCMGGAAFTLLADLANMGSVFDRVLYFGFLSTIPIYLLIGVKLLWVRKFIRLGEDLMWGYRLGKWEYVVGKISREEVAEVRLANLIPTPNVAPNVHDDRQYYFRGHWRVLTQLKSGKTISLDRHNERGALEGLLKAVETWAS